MHQSPSWKSAGEQERESFSACVYLLGCLDTSFTVPVAGCRISDRPEGETQTEIMPLLYLFRISAVPRKSKKRRHQSLNIALFTLLICEKLYFFHKSFNVCTGHGPTHLQGSIVQCRNPSRLRGIIISGVYH